MSGLENYIELPVKKLVYADWNYKKEDAKQANKLRNNINKNGQIENIIVRELDDGNYEVVNGNHRLAVLKELEYENVICYNMGKISLIDAKRVAIETNETKFEYDRIKLAGIIDEIMSRYDKVDLLNTLPYNDAELEKMKELFEWKWDENDVEDEELNSYILNVTTVQSEYNVWKKWVDLTEEKSDIEGLKKAFELLKNKFLPAEEKNNEKNDG